MIKAEHGNVRIEGNPVDVLADFTCIIKSLRECLTEEMGRELADKTITHCGELAYMTDEERKADVERIKRESKNSPMDILKDLLRG